MRCRQGDLAIMVSGPNVGRIVEVISFLGKANDPVNHPGDDYWFIEYRGCQWNDNFERLISSDSRMLPIRPGDLQETEEKERTVNVQ